MGNETAKPKMTAGVFIKKAIFYVIGFFFIAVGIIISKKSGTGISPVSCVPYALELIWGIELGAGSRLIYAICIVLQFIILRKFKISIILQFVATFILGYFVTFCNLFVKLPDPANYGIQLVYLVISFFVIAIGVALYVMPGFPPNPPEGLATAISQVSNGKLTFGNAKIIVDTTMVIISAALSLIFLGGLKSVREGTILAAIIIGKIVGVIMKKYRAKAVAWMNK